MNCCAASMGPFTVNLWERANATDQDGDLFEYIYSHSAYATRDEFANVDAFHPNQVSWQLPLAAGPPVVFINLLPRSHALALQRCWGIDGITDYSMAR